MHIGPCELSRRWSPQWFMMERHPRWKESDSQPKRQGNNKLRTRNREIWGTAVSHPLLAPEEWDKAVRWACVCYQIFKELSIWLHWWSFRIACKSLSEAVKTGRSKETSLKRVKAIRISIRESQVKKVYWKSWEASRWMLLQEPRKAAAAEWQEECKPRPPKRKAKWLDSDGRLHCKTQRK